MSTTIITVRGLRWNVEADGFGKETDDRDAGIAAIETALAAIDPDALAKMHADCLAWIAKDCEGDRPAALDAIEVAGHAAATVGWHRPDAAILMVSAKS